MTDVFGTTYIQHHSEEYERPVELVEERNDSWAASELGRLLSDRSLVPDPYPLYAHLRANSPVRVCDGITIVTPYSYVNQLFRDPRLSRQLAAVRENDALGPRETDDPMTQRARTAQVSMLINQDNPDHNRLRRILDKAFRPKAIEQWQTRVQQITDDLITRVTGRDEFDLLSELGFPLPESVICALMGVPLEDHALWTKWSDTAIRASRTTRASREEQLAVLEALRSFADYFSDLVARRRNSLNDDLVSELIRAEDEGDRLNELELLGTLQMLIAAGHETTANLIGNGMYALLRNPDQYEMLRRDPDLVPNALEELLRYETPSHWALPRIATEDIDLGDENIIRKGAVVILAINSANHDPEVFDEADTLDITRDRNRHIAFSAGPHFCLGAMLARQEARAMFHAIVTRLPRLELVEEPQWKNSFTRGLTELRVRPATG